MKSRLTNGKNLNLSSNGKANQDVLEISPTGYGYVSVPTESAEEKGKTTNPSCGGL
ncbi:hypothetical protein [Heyndrickxia ginsengihumi]|uniref:Uncharacterized protein n=1 Tax=Heyndrickxia ginsengihumi TaxID=363870 RepID=A0A6M0P8L2_9BACI|nr:hypothetical protein [Heyndrickxia ginsengihumi]MCM3025111.1 hypothetical protein [Heyndrickxia ginsengihumi]NEY20911.1 hypothetical protein [Heyndrickxia ginsengihumi]